MGEDPTVQRSNSRRMSIVMGARRHLEWGHEKYVMDMIHSHPAQVNSCIVFFFFWVVGIIKIITLVSYVWYLLYTSRIL